MSMYPTAAEALAKAAEAEAQKNAAPKTPEQIAEGQKRYELIARAMWELTGERLRYAAQNQAEAGKWLVVTTTSVHLAALYLVSQESVPIEVRSNPWCYWPFIIGIFLMIVAGLLSWMNWYLWTLMFTDWMNPNMLLLADHWPKGAATSRTVE